MFSYEPLAKTLKEKKLDLSYVCKEAGLKEGVLICKMNGNEYISMESLDKLCNVLKVSVDKVISWKEGEQKVLEKVNVNWDFVVSHLNGLSLNELSEKSRLSRTALSKSKNRNSQVRLRNVMLMAKALGCPLADLILPVGSADAE